MNDNENTWIELHALVRNVVEFLKEKSGSTEADPQLTGISGGSAGRDTGRGIDVTAGSGSGGGQRPTVTLTDESEGTSVTELIFVMPGLARGLFGCR